MDYQTAPLWRYANLTNGLAFPHDDVCHFLSTHGHNYAFGYFRPDCMPYSAVLRLLRGQPIVVVDATPHAKALTDGIKFGLTTWCLVFNRALGCKVKVAPWQTREMELLANSDKHRWLVRRVRRYRLILGDSGPVCIGNSGLVQVEVHQHFQEDDRPHALAARLEVGA